MNYGLFLSAQYPAEDDPVARLEEHLEQVQVAREAGFRTIMGGQHFLSDPFQMLQLVPFLARLAPEAGEMRVGAGILLTTLLNPVEVAENVATLDILTRGRFILGVGFGYRSEENHAFGIFDRRVETFTAKLDVIRRLLEGEEVTAEGNGYRLEAQRLTLRSLQRPRPPLWIAANNDAAVVRAAKLADTWLVSPHTNLDELERQVALFRGERDADPEELPVIREAYVASTDAEALAGARPYLDQKYKTYVDWGQSDVLPAADTLRREWDELHAGRFILGGPATAAAQISEVIERLGVTEVIFRVQWPGMPQSDVMRSLRLLIDEVLPQVSGASAS